jgi:hypothetical protein
MSEIDRELMTLESERKMSELALKGQQNKIAEQLRGEMGKDINRTVKKKLSIWDKIDNFLRML